MGVMTYLMYGLPVNIIFSIVFRDYRYFVFNFIAAIAFFIFKKATGKANPPPFPPVPAGKSRVCVAGYWMSPYTAKAHELAHIIATKYTRNYESWYYWDNWGFSPFIVAKFDPVPFPPHLKGHSSSPMVWIERAGGDIEPIGGSDYFSEWVLKKFPEDAELTEIARSKPGSFYKKMSHVGPGYMEPTVK
eukprot:PhF_6_TR24019/c0_g1_i1/m.33629